MRKMAERLEQRAREWDKRGNGEVDYIKYTSDFKIADLLRELAEDFRACITTGDRL